MAKILSASLTLLTLGCSVPPTNIPASATVVPNTQSPATVIPVIAKIPTPAEGYLYHGVYPGGHTGHEDDIILEDLLSYEETVGKSAAWVYFSNNWYHSRAFPTETAIWIRETGSIPYIRLMLRSGLKHDGNEPVFTLQNILDGKFDADLHAWCANARSFGTSILAEYGTEANSDSFAWSGISNGAGNTNDYGDPIQPDGPERFKDAYRHIIQICRDEGARNITWVFHIGNESFPDEDWNRMENYYPGNKWIDWIGVSTYGTYGPQSSYVNDFSAGMDDIHKHILKLAPHKPIIIAEFATAKNNPKLDQAQWAREALVAITSLRYANVIGFSWWNERWQNDDNPLHDTTMRVQDSAQLAQVFQELVAKNPIVLAEIAP
ncbi:MAG: glycosyl hydrolase [Anaerolineales bacterium]